MNDPSDMASGPPSGALRDRRVPVSAHWSEALGDLLGARLALFQLEATTAARQAARGVASLAVAALATIFGWALVLAGGIAALAVATAWPWYWIALVTASLHALVAAVCLLFAKATTAPAFPITRAEFLKDREWLESLKTPRKSND
ncbi:MAG: phage holin family protein [Verrucomicrobia bacterium]|nr:phage holin family protein [Verrucomicrobiota bacterium]